MGITVKNPFAGKKGYNCFGCSPDNPIGLHLDFRVEGNVVLAEWTPGENYQGWMNILHGGIQATLMDEIAGWFVLVKLGSAGVTSKMEVRLLKPAHMHHSPFHLKAELMETHWNIAMIKVELSDSQEVLVADSLMHYYIYPEEIARDRMHYPGMDAFLDI
ncbi:MAG: PaaI family thioesterase [Bacteroidetes bacterium]|nr:PaaI family thioesterase [Bacteroidota bacterium]